MKTAAAVLAVGALVGIGYLVFLAPAPSVKSGAPQELTAATVPSLSAPPLDPRPTDEVIAALIDKAEAAIAQGSFGSGPDDDVFENAQYGRCDRYDSPGCMAAFAKRMGLLLNSTVGRG